MAPGTSALSFDIDDVEGLFRALCEAIDGLSSGGLSSRNAVTSAMLAWHITDWFWAERPRVDKSLKAFQERVRTECRALALMCDIATGTKHRGTDWQPRVARTASHQGAFDSGFSTGFDVSWLKLVLKDGSVVDFVDEISTARDYWRSSLGLE